MAVKVNSDSCSILNGQCEETEVLKYGGIGTMYCQGGLYMNVNGHVIDLTTNKVYKEDIIYDIPEMLQPSPYGLVFKDRILYLIMGK